MKEFVKKYKFSLISGTLCFIIAIIIAYKVYHSREENIAMAFIYAMPFLVVTMMEIDYIYDDIKRHRKWLT